MVACQEEIRIFRKILIFGRVGRDIVLPALDRHYELRLLLGFPGQEPSVKQVRNG
jgi:hypothetical protein